jgi:hypothetical protein
MGVAIHWQAFCTAGGQALSLGENSWRMEVAASADGYRCAQLDDYRALPRSRFAWRAPLRLSLRARAAGQHLKGTWGFGLWNDPFSFSLGGSERRLPALPNAAWFFHASPPNHLALHDDHPADGFLAATFSSPTIPSALLAAGLPVLPLLFVPPLAARLRQAAGLLVREDAVQLDDDVTQWHDYTLEWWADRVCFMVDGQVRLETRVAPLGRLGLVMWVDNQYAAFTPQGVLKFGNLAFEENMWLEVADVTLEPLDPQGEV